MMPTADDIAAAVVATCRETDEHATTLYVGECFPQSRARHYAMHALLHCFRDFPGARALFAKLLNAPGKASYFHRSSTWHVLGQGPGKKARAEWWSDDAYARVIEAIGVREAEATKVPSAPPPVRAPRPVQKPTPAAPIATERPSAFLRTKWDLGRFPGPAVSGKASLYEDLRKAVENTAKMTPPKGKDDGEA